MDPDAQAITSAAAAAASQKIAGEAYRDVAKPALEELGKIGGDLAKTARLAMAPFQYTAMLQQRLERYFSRSVAMVPEDRRITPKESTVMRIADGLKYEDDSSTIAELYVQLLARAIDGERVGEAHPAFVEIISQLTPDEALFIDKLHSREYTLVLKLDEGWTTPNQESRVSSIRDSGLPDFLVKKSFDILFPYDALAQPALFYVFLEHLYHVGLVQYTNEPITRGDYRGFQSVRPSGATFVFIRLSSFGRLFHQACVSEVARQLRRGE